MKSLKQLKESLRVSVLKEDKYMIMDKIALAKSKIIQIQTAKNKEIERIEKDIDRMRKDLERLNKTEKD